MAYDLRLADQIRETLGILPGLTEKKMFGGLAFLINGNMTIAASGEGGLLVRIAPEDTDKLVATTNAEVMVMRGRAMNGWLRVPGTIDDAELAKWVKICTKYTNSLPPK